MFNKYATEMRYNPTIVELTFVGAPRQLLFSIGMYDTTVISSTHSTYTLYITNNNSAHFPKISVHCIGDNPGYVNLFKASKVLIYGCKVWHTLSKTIAFY